MSKKIFAITVLTVFVFNTSTAFACTWAAYHNGNASFVVRTMDWYWDDEMVVKGHGRGIEVKAANTPNALTYTTKYASLQIHSFLDHVTDAMNEKGLQVSILYLQDSEIPVPVDGRRDVDLIYLLCFFVSNFATVREAVDGIKTINILPFHRNVMKNPLGRPIEFSGRHLHFHFALADAAGDKAIIEFIKGEMRIYHGSQYDAMTNEPNMEVHLALEKAGYRPFGGIDPLDRRARARRYMQDMVVRNVTEPERALLAMRGLLTNVWAGTEELDPVDDIPYPTIWGAVIDQNSLTYYITRYNTWCTEKFDFTMFDPSRPEVTVLRSNVCMVSKTNIFDISRSPLPFPFSLFNFYQYGLRVLVHVALIMFFFLLLSHGACFIIRKRKKN